jgi:hypothetical protein
MMHVDSYKLYFTLYIYTVNYKNCKSWLAVLCSDINMLLQFRGLILSYPSE